MSDVDDESESEVICEACERTWEGDEEETLLCSNVEACRSGYHMYCLNPPLSEIPDEDRDWFCPVCHPLGSTAELADYFENYYWKDYIRDPQCKSDKVTAFLASNDPLGLPIRLRVQSGFIHTGRIVSKRRTESDRYEYLVQFKSGANGRNLPYSRWIFLDDHDCCIGSEVVAAKYLSSWLPAEIYIPSYWTEKDFLRALERNGERRYLFLPFGSGEYAIANEIQSLHEYYGRKATPKGKCVEYALAVMELHERQNVVNHYLLSQSNTEYEYPDVEDYWKELRSLDFRDTNAYNCWLRKQSFINAGPLVDGCTTADLRNIHKLQRSSTVSNSTHPAGLYEIKRAFSGFAEANRSIATSDSSLCDMENLLLDGFQKGDISLLDYRHAFLECGILDSCKLNGGGSEKNKFALCSGSKAVADTYFRNESISRRCTSQWMKDMLQSVTSGAVADNRNDVGISGACTSDTQVTEIDDDIPPSHTTKHVDWRSCDYWIGNGVQPDFATKDGSGLGEESVKCVDSHRGSTTNEDMVEVGAKSEGFQSGMAARGCVHDIINKSTESNCGEFSRDSYSSTIAENVVCAEYQLDSATNDCLLEVRVDDCKVDVVEKDGKVKFLSGCRNTNADNDTITENVESSDCQSAVAVMGGADFIADNVAITGYQYNAALEDSNAVAVEGDVEGKGSQSGVSLEIECDGTSSVNVECGGNRRDSPTSMDAVEVNREGEGLLSDMSSKDNSDAMEVDVVRNIDSQYGNATRNDMVEASMESTDCQSAAVAAMDGSEDMTARNVEHTGHQCNVAVEDSIDAAISGNVEGKDSKPNISLEIECDGTSSMNVDSRGNEYEVTTAKNVEHIGHQYNVAVEDSNAVAVEGDVEGKGSQSGVSLEIECDGTSSMNVDSRGNQCEDTTAKNVEHIGHQYNVAVEDSNTVAVEGDVEGKGSQSGVSLEIECDGTSSVNVDSRGNQCEDTTAKNVEHIGHQYNVAVEDSNAVAVEGDVEGKGSQSGVSLEIECDGTSSVNVDSSGNQCEDMTAKNVEHIGHQYNVAVEDSNTVAVEGDVEGKGSQSGVSLEIECDGTSSVNVECGGNRRDSPTSMDTVEVNREGEGLLSDMSSKDNSDAMEVDVVRNIDSQYGNVTRNDMVEASMESTDCQSAAVAAMDGSEDMTARNVEHTGHQCNVAVEDSSGNMIGFGSTNDGPDSVVHEDNIYCQSSNATAGGDGETIAEFVDDVDQCKPLSSVPKCDRIGKIVTVDGMVGKVVRIEKKRYVVRLPEGEILCLLKTLSVATKEVEDIFNSTLTNYSDDDSDSGRQVGTSDIGDHEETDTQSSSTQTTQIGIRHAHSSDTVAATDDDPRGNSFRENTDSRETMPRRVDINRSARGVDAEPLSSKRVSGHPPTSSVSVHDSTWKHSQQRGDLIEKMVPLRDGASQNHDRNRSPRPLSGSKRSTPASYVPSSHNDIEIKRSRNSDNQNMGSVDDTDSGRAHSSDTVAATDDVPRGNTFGENTDSRETMPRRVDINRSARGVDAEPLSSKRVSRHPPTSTVSVHDSTWKHSQQRGDLIEKMVPLRDGASQNHDRNRSPRPLSGSRRSTPASYVPSSHNDIEIKRSRNSDNQNMGSVDDTDSGRAHSSDTVAATDDVPRGNTFRENTDSRETMPRRVDINRSARGVDAEPLSSKRVSRHPPTSSVSVHDSTWKHSQQRGDLIEKMVPLRDGASQNHDRNRSPRPLSGSRRSTPASYVPSSHNDIEIKRSRNSDNQNMGSVDDTDSGRAHSSDTVAATDDDPRGNSFGENTDSRETMPRRVDINRSARGVDAEPLSSKRVSRHPPTSSVSVHDSTWKHSQQRGDLIEKMVPLRDGASQNHDRNRSPRPLSGSKVHPQRDINAFRYSGPSYHKPTLLVENTIQSSIEYKDTSTSYYGENFQNSGKRSFFETDISSVNSQQPKRPSLAPAQHLRLQETDIQQGLSLVSSDNVGEALSRSSSSDDDLLDMVLKA